MQGGGAGGCAGGGSLRERRPRGAKALVHHARERGHLAALLLLRLPLCFPFGGDGDLDGLAGELLPPAECLDL